MKNVQNATCDGDFAPLRGQNCSEIKFRPIYMIYRVQYAIIQHFNQKLQKTENFYLATILK